MDIYLHQIVVGGLVCFWECNQEIEISPNLHDFCGHGMGKGRANLVLEICLFGKLWFLENIDAKSN